MTSSIKQILEIKEFYQSILDSIINGVWVSDANDIIYYTNRGMEKIAGIPSKNIIGSHVLNDFPESTLKYFRPHYLKAKKDLKPVYYNAVPVRTPSGRNSYQSGWLIPRIKEEEYDGIICTVEDVTDHLEAEQKFKESQAQLKKLNIELEKRVEERTRRLKKSEERFKYLVSSNPAIIYTSKISEDFGATFISENIIDKLGYKPEDLTQESDFWIRYIHPEDKERVILTLDKLFEKEHLVYEYRFKFKDETYHWLRDEVRLIKDQEGNPIETIGSIIDITDRKEAEEKLKESEEKFRTMADQSFLGIIIIQDAKVIYVNDAESKLMGYSTQEMIKWTQKDLFKHIHPDDRGKAIERNSKYQEGQNIGPFFSYRILTKSGEIKIVEIFTKVIFFNEREAILTYVLDVTEKKKAEQDLKASEERFRTLYENIAGGTLIIDENYIIKDVNKQTCEITGYTRDEIIGESCSKLCDKELNHQKCPIWEEGIEGFTSMDTNIKCNNGRKHPILKNAKKIELDGKVHILEIFQDIEEKKEVEQELIKLNKLKTDLLTRSSHELKTPLMSIKGFTELFTLKYQDNLNNEESFFLSEIKKGCSRLETLINNILKTAELHSDIVHLEKNEENLSMIVKSSVKELKSLVKSRNQNITLMLHDKLITMLEKKQIRQVLNNLLTNAIKYTPPYGNIEVKSDIKEGFYIISIKDSGIGFSEEEKKRIFKQFGKIERYGQGFNVITEGSGLGLYISKKIIDLHGGNIWLESEGKNKGSIFYFSLPIIKN